VTQFQKGHLFSSIHGATSPRQIRPLARRHKRRFLRRAGLRLGDLDAVAGEYLTHWARGMAQLDLREDAGADTRKEYWSAYASVQRALEKLEGRLRGLGLLNRPGDRASGDLDGLVAVGQAIRERQAVNGDG
jgi:hypothetical protein